MYILSFAEDRFRAECSLMLAINTDIRFEMLLSSSYSCCCNSGACTGEGGLCYTISCILRQENNLLWNSLFNSMSVTSATYNAFTSCKFNIFLKVRFGCRAAYYIYLLRRGFDEYQANDDEQTVVKWKTNETEIAKLSHLCFFFKLKTAFGHYDSYSKIILAL